MNERAASPLTVRAWIQTAAVMVADVISIGQSFSGSDMSNMLQQLHIAVSCYQSRCSCTVCWNAHALCTVRRSVVWLDILDWKMANYKEQRMLISESRM